jgi:dienelactone hydrolase
MRFTGDTEADCRAWQERFAAKLRALLGPHRPPEKWDVVLERRVTLDDHVREERRLVAAGLDPVPLYVLLPRDRAPRPGVLALHGHGAFGYDPVAGRDETTALRAEIAASHYDYGLQLVRRGYVVATPCLTPFGRRLTGGGIAPRPGDACGATFVSFQLLGRLLMAENLRDILWTLEYLASRPEVDRGRLGCVGLSYGGRMTMLATALEPRIRVAVVSGALNCLQERLATGHSAGCQVIPNLLAYGDVPEIASLIAPRPCLWEVGTRDALIDPTWAERALDRMRRAYRALGVMDQLEVDRFDGGHQWHGEAAYPFLAKVLKP